jgi:hypothetical protein
MRNPFTRQREVEPEPAPPRPMVATRQSAARTDLTCAACSTVIAYGVRPERVDADAEFFLDAHKPFCVGMRAAG